MSTERGLVISPPIKVGHGGIHIKTAKLDLQELRFALLFWDRLEYPSNAAIHIKSGPEAQFLESEKILHRTPWQFHGSALGPILEAHIGVFRQLDQKEPGAWSLATGERTLSFPEADLIEGRGGLVQLHRAIPVPDKDVPLEDILAFRERRASELHALRHHLEAIYQRILTAGDGALAMRSEVEALEDAVAAHVRVSKEAGFRSLLADVGMNMNLNLIAGAAVAAQEFGMPKVAVLLGTVAALGISIGPSLSWGKSTGTPFRYVSAYHKELF